MAAQAAVNYSPSASYAPSAMAGAAAYGRVAQSALSPAQSSLILHERLCQEAVAAKAAYEAGRLDSMCRHVEKITRVLLALQNDIKHTPGNVNSAILSGFYLHLHSALSTLLCNNDVSAACDNIIDTMKMFNSNLSIAARAAA